MARIRENYVSGTLSQLLPSDDGDPDYLTMKSDSLAFLPEVVAPDIAVITLDPFGAHGRPETVLVTAHSTGSTTATFDATIGRGYANSTVNRHIVGTLWAHAPINEDFTEFEERVTNIENTPGTALLTAAPVTLVLDAAGVIGDSSAVSRANHRHRLAAPRRVTDGVLNSTTTVTSATANFDTAVDPGRSIKGTGIPVGATISSVTNATTVVISAAATQTGAGRTLQIGTTPAASAPSDVASTGTSTEVARADHVHARESTAVLQNALLHAGEIKTWPGAQDTVPNGWLPCDGRSLLQADYVDLFDVIGTTYGNVDGSHFNIPDARGRVIIGMDDMGTAAGDASNMSQFTTDLGSVGGAEIITLVEGQMPLHNHGVGIGRIRVTPGPLGGIDVPAFSDSALIFDIGGLRTGATPGLPASGHGNVQPFIAMIPIIFTGLAT